MIQRGPPWLWVGMVCVLGLPSIAEAQAAGQVWASATFEGLASERLSYSIDLEPKAQAVARSGQPTWFDVDATPHVEYSVVSWMEILGEAVIGFKNESTGVNSTTVAPRVGVQVHFLSQLLQAHPSRGAGRERLPRRRLITNTLLRLEREQTSYNTDAPSKTTWRLRDRVAVAYPINRAKTTVDGAVYFTSDGEMFVPLDRASNGAFIDQVRIRTGVGYRRSFAWRFEVLYIWNGKRNQESGALAVDAHAIDVRLQYDF